MKQTISVMSGFIGLTLALPVAAQMMQGGMMGGGHRAMINLVSPADSPTQIRRGAIMIGSYAFSMMGQNSTGPATPGTGGSGIRVVLRLYGVTDNSGLVTSAGNHLIFEGELTMPTANRVPINIDQQFPLNAGNALVQISVGMERLTGPATITIDRIAVQDGSDNAFAMPGVAFAQPTPQVTPAPTPGAECTRDSDCNDGDPTTRDLCMPIGCVHMRGGMGPGGGPMM